MVQPLRSDRQKAAIGRDSHDRLRDAELDDLRVCDAMRGVVLPLRQEIVSRDENGREQQVEVGVHRGLQGRRCVLSTADFDPAAPKPSNTGRLGGAHRESTGASQALGRERLPSR